MRVAHGVTVGLKKDDAVKGWVVAIGEEVSERATD